jgi:MmyB-like transcription regulator ligand binding domain
VLRATLHPEGLAPRIANFAQWRAHLLERLERQIDLTADATLAGLLEEVRGFPTPGGAADADESARDHVGAGVVVPLRLRTDQGTLAFLYTTTIFGTPLDVTLAELAIEAFFPADSVTADALRSAAENATPRNAGR